MSTSTEILLVILSGCLIIFRRDWINQAIVWLDDHSGAMTAIATGVIALLTYFLVTTSNRQWQVSDEAMRVSNRPYVEMGQQKGGLVADWYPTPNGGTGIGIWFNNAGNTPAQRFYVNADFLPCDPTTFTHLSLKPVPPKAWDNNGFELKAGQSVTMAKGWPTPLTWIAGSTIPAHSDFSVLEDFAKDKIAAALKKGNGAFSIVGSYEYIDVFDEYCCEAFQIDNDGKTFRLSFGDWQDVACQTDIPNICLQKGKPTVPLVPGGHVAISGGKVGSPVPSALKTHQ